MKILVTGGAGFIGSALVRHIIKETSHTVLNVDKLTYAGNLDSLKSVEASNKYHFEKLDICNFELLDELIKDFYPDIIMHLAAESHVDRSIDDPSDFLKTNIFGTFNLLQASKNLYESNKEKKFIFHHVSTDEVYGDLSLDDSPFKETNNYDPSSPYSASKASSDHLVRAWSRTYKLPTVITNCSNNYGPYHFPEKLIPHVILSAIHRKKIPVYGDGSQIRDWLFVEDHVKALLMVATKGTPGETYNIGGLNEMTNIDVIKKICSILNKKIPCDDGLNYKDLITKVTDRPGHDKRYAIDCSKIQEELNWRPEESFDSGIIKTVEWYLENKDWWKKLVNKDYKLERKGKI